MTCPKCKTEIPNGVDQCPRCHVILSKAKAPPPKPYRSPVTATFEPSTKPGYTTTRLFAKVLEWLGGSLSIGGVLLTYFGAMGLWRGKEAILQISGLFLFVVGVSWVLVGVIVIVGGQLTRAVLDMADNSKKQVWILDRLVPKKP